MAKIDDRLRKLKTRRRGLDRLARLNDIQKADVLLKSVFDEPWQKRSPNAPHTRYALGAMEEVDPDYTRISLETADRVEEQLRKGLTAKSFNVDFRRQGSVPLNVHIRGISDVDLLNIDTDFLTYRRDGARSLMQQYHSPSNRTSAEVIWELRKAAETILSNSYPAAQVDASGGKAITISGGSLARPVDVVPCHWYDTVEYQSSNQECDRAITLFNKKTRETIDNWPFLHIKRVVERCTSCLGGLRKAIRLCKNVKADFEEDSGLIDLPSFDITSIMYHADQASLFNGYVRELSILCETQRHLDYLYHNQEAAKALRTPDQSRRIFDKPEKFGGLLRLSCEFDRLLREVALEHQPNLGTEPSMVACRAALSSVVLPAAA